MKIIRHMMPTVNGLGDVVHAVARPIARTLDKTIGTKLENCGSCDKRRQKLNEKFPMKTILSVLIICLTWSASAQTNWFYNTNMYSGLTDLTNAYVRATTNDSYTDTYVILANKINANNRILQAWRLSATNDIHVALTNATFLDQISGPSIKLDISTITHSTNATTLPLGTILCDPDYLYRVVGNYTNALGTNFYRIAWDKTSW